MTTKEKLQKIVCALNLKQCKDLEVIKISDLTILAEYFVICSGTSNTQVKALADEVEYEMSEAGLEPDHVEGKSTDWILLEYEGIVIHIFYQKTRDFYSLDRLWSDGKKIDINELLENTEGSH